MKKTPGSDGNGLTISELFAVRPGVGLTFDDIIILPRFVEAPPERIVLKMELAPGLEINPLISSPMDTVTEWETAVHMALNGCLGVLHANLDPDEAVRQVRRVKRFQMGFIWDPVCLPPDATVADVRRIKAEQGFSSVPITEDGGPRSAFLGIVTRTCIDFEQGDDKPVREVMMPRERILTLERAKVPNLEKAKAFFRDHPESTKLPILEDDGSLHALVNRRNLVKSEQYPDMLTDENEQLRVFAAVSTHPEDDERVRMLTEAGIDGFVIDSSQGGTGYAADRLRKIAAADPMLPVIAGNAVTPDQVAPLSGACAFRVGMGSGSICITQGQYGLGRAQISAIRQLAGHRVIADGGIRTAGDIVKALAVGSAFVMLGRYIAGCDETPSQTFLHGGRRYKLYRGMGSAGAMAARGAMRYGGSEGYNPREIIAQGVEGLVPAAGPLDDRLAEALSAVRGFLRQLGCDSVQALHREVNTGSIRFELRSDAARREGAVHDLEPLPQSE